MGELPRNHMKSWTAEEVAQVKLKYVAGMPISTLADMFGRTRSSIISKLPNRYYDHTTYSCPEVCPDAPPDSTRPDSTRPTPKAVTQTKPKETQMILKIEDKKFINGTDLSTMTADDIVQLIAQAEATIKKMDTVENKPKALVKRIAKQKANIEILVALCDEHFPD